MDKQLAQVYKVKLTNKDDISKIRPAQFIYENNKTSLIKGFISNVDGATVTFTLFEPAPILVDAIVIKESITNEEIVMLLEYAFEQNLDMKDHWIEVLS